jgi:tetratricopeptide (TPR) repeat protein
MAEWAKHVAGGRSSDPLERAHKLFTALTQHTRWDDNGRRLTATEAFENWITTNACMSCQDYTFLYVALARSVGLSSWCAEVQRDYSGKPVTHFCAAIFAGETALLVDPIYNWFGVAHQEYFIRDDIHAVAAYMTVSCDATMEEIGLKLTPDWASPHFWVALGRIYRGNWKAAERPLRIGLKLDPKSWIALYSLGTLEMYEGKSEEAIEHLRRCLSLKSDLSAAHFSLGVLLGRSGNLVEAREELRAYMRGRTVPALAAQAGEALAYINQKLDTADQLLRAPNSPQPVDDGKTHSW